MVITMNYWTEDKTEVRFHMLRPAEIVARRKAVSVAWVPLGTLEWHGRHNPIGSDTLQAEGLCIIGARKYGGVVMPPVYWGDVRLGNVVETVEHFRCKDVAAALELPSEGFFNFPTTREEQMAIYDTLLTYILYEVQSYGYEDCILLCGHYPLMGPAGEMAEAFNAAGQRMHAHAFVDYALLREEYPYSGDHGAYWETSHMLALHPERVDIELLSHCDDPMLGVNTPHGMYPQDADGAFGYMVMERAADHVWTKIGRG